MKKIFVSLGVLLALAVSAAPLAQPAYAYDVNSTKSQICAGITATTGGNCNKKASTDTLNNVIKDIVNLFSVVVGIVAVIMIIVSGMRFITSGGEANSVASAKKGLMFAIIGLIIVALAQVIVHFVLGHTSDLASGSIITMWS